MFLKKILCLIIIGLLSLSLGAFSISNLTIANATGISSNELTFTFDSQNNPWGINDLQVLKKAIRTFYPIIKEIYGSPASSLTVNIAHNPVLSSGTTSITSNNLIDINLKDSSHLDVLCHEMIHAFHGVDVINLSSYEEGMTRAVEVEVFSRLANYTYEDKNHSYGIDMYYEAMNKATLGGNIFDGYTSTLQHYQLCGYAWGKLLLENPKFFLYFNEGYYKRCKTDLSVKNSENTLISIIEAIQPTVESVPFRTWYKRQGCLDTSPPVGKFIYQRIFQFAVDCFSRSEALSVKMEGNVPITYTFYDCNDKPLDFGSNITNSYGVFENIPKQLYKTNYIGRIKVIASTNDSSIMISDTSYRYWNTQHEEGVFGVLPYSQAGTITFYPSDIKTGVVSAKVVNGCFYAPSLKNTKGKIKAVFYTSFANRFTRYFTKDASNYYLFMSPSIPTGINCTLTSGETVLNWDSVDNAQTYNVKRSLIPGGKYSIIATDVHGTTYTDKSITDTHNTYYYTVSAVNLGNESFDSEPANIIPYARIASKITKPQEKDPLIGP